MKEVILENVASPELIRLSCFIDEQFDCMCSLCEFLEEAIRKEVKRRHAWVRRQRNNYEGEEEQALNSVSIDDSLFEVKRDFPRIVRYSLMVSMMSATEACLVRLCRVARRRLEIRDEFNDKGSNVIQRALKYLEEKGGLDISRMRYYIELADSLRNLRNAITHSEGCTKGRKEESDILIFAESGTGVEIDKRSNIILSDRFVLNNTRGMKRLLVQLYEKLKKQVARK